MYRHRTCVWHETLTATLYDAERSTVRLKVTLGNDEKHTAAANVNTYAERNLKTLWVGAWVGRRVDGWVGGWVGVGG